MVITNGKILIHKSNDEDALIEQLAVVKNYCINAGLPEPEFVKDSELNFPAYIIPEGLTFKTLSYALGDIKLRAINEDQMILMERQVVHHRYDFTDKEMRDMADRSFEVSKTKTNTEIESKASAKAYKTKIEHMEIEYATLQDKYTTGWEYRDTNCSIKLNFADGLKYYFTTNPQGEEILIKTEPITKYDRQLRIEHSFEQPVSTIDESDSENGEINFNKAYENVKNEQSDFVKAMLNEDGTTTETGTTETDDDDSNSDDGDESDEDDDNAADDKE